MSSEGMARSEALAAAHHPLFNDRKLKLGTFSTNLSGGCAISTVKSLYCWGWSSYGKTGTGTSAIAAQLPTPVSGGGSWTHVSMGSDSACGIQTDGSAWCVPAPALAHIYGFYLRGVSKPGMRRREIPVLNV